MDLKSKIPIEATTGLTTKGKISITSTAVYEQTVAEGGGTEFIRSMMSDLQ
jgi:hypothetical protein